MEEGAQTYHGAWHSFCYLPKARFETQADGEDIILILRAHPITQLYWIINGVLFILLIFVLNILLVDILTPVQKVFMNLSSVVFVASYYFFNFITYFFNVGIVTRKRIVDVDFSSVIRKEVSETLINRVEDITARNSGYFSSLFNFGNVHVQTAGALETIEFINVPRPTDVVKIINSIM